MSEVQQLFKKYLYNQSGMMCDPTFVECVWRDWMEVFSVDDLRRASTAMDVHYDGTFEVEMTDYDEYGKDYIVIKVYPVTDEGNKTLDDCVCGEAWINTEKWNALMDRLEDLRND